MKPLNLHKLFDKDLREDDIVLLYQMGQKGSSIIESSFEKAQIPSWQIPTFEDYEEFLIYQNTKDVSYFVEWHIRKIYQFMLGNRCRMLQKKDYLKIISLVQDPIATVVSRFFEDLHIHGIAEKKGKTIHDDMKHNAKFLLNTFDSHIRFDYFTGWFEQELAKNFQVNVLSYIDSSAKDYWRIEQSGRDILLIKYEAISRLTKVLADFLDQPNFHLRVDEQKPDSQSETYQLFMQTYPFEKLFHLYQAPFYQAVYNENEIEQFKMKWSSA